MTNPDQVATFHALPGGYARMDINDPRVMNMLTRSELLQLAADATATAAQITAPTPAAAAGRLTKRNR